MSTDEIPVVEGAYDAACAILAKYVDGYGEVRGLTAYQAGIRAVDAAAPLIAAEAEKRGAVKALREEAARGERAAACFVDDDAERQRLGRKLLSRTARAIAAQADRIESGDVVV